MRDAMAGDDHAELYPTIIDPSETASAASTCVRVTTDDGALGGAGSVRSTWVSEWNMFALLYSLYDFIRLSDTVVRVK